MYFLTLQSIIHLNISTKRSELLNIADVVNQWLVFVRKEKAIYHTMNSFNYDQTRKCLIGEGKSSLIIGWCPTASLTAVQYALQAAGQKSGSLVPPIMNELSTVMEPPTYHKTNKYTKAFQVLIDAYGVAKYKEVNPGIFTVITFPFLFALMFGDFGHGIFMLCIGLWLVYDEKNLTSKKRGEVDLN